VLPQGLDNLQEAAPRKEADDANSNKDGEDHKHDFAAGIHGNATRLEPDVCCSSESYLLRSTERWGGSLWS